MDITAEQNLNHENYWEKAFKKHKSLVIEHWKNRSWVNLLSLAWSVLKRLAVGYFVMPPVVIFLILFFESYSSGLVSTLNSLFSGLAANPVNGEVASTTIKFWHIISLIFFGLTWLMPWTSPAHRYADREMDKWHRINGDKMFPPTDSETLE
jgi:hypothetical protein